MIKTMPHREVSKTLRAWAATLSIRHSPGFGIMQSVFRSAARRRSRQARENPERRGGELKTGWTEPLHNSSAYGF